MGGNIPSSKFDLTLGDGVLFCEKGDIIWALGLFILFL